MMLVHHPPEPGFQGPSARHFPWICITLPGASLEVSVSNSHKSARCRARADVPRLDPALLGHVSIPVLKDSAFLNGCEADSSGEEGETGQLTSGSGLLTGWCFFRVCLSVCAQVSCLFH